MTWTPSSLTLATNVRDGASHVPGYAFSLARQTQQGFRVVVLDDGSTDGTADLLEHARIPDLTVLRRRAVGLQAARKELLGHVQTPLVLLLDIDIRLRPQAVERLLQAIDAPSVAGVSCRIRNRSPGVVASGHDGVRRLAYRLRADRDGNAAWLEGSPTVWRTDVLDEVGGTATGPVSEDLDLSLRVRDAGHRLVLLQEDLATHADPDTWRDLWRREADTGRREGRMVRDGQARLLAGPRVVRLGPLLLPLYIALLPLSLVLLPFFGPPRRWAWPVFHWMNLAYAWGFVGGFLRGGSRIRPLALGVPHRPTKEVLDEED